MENNPKGLSASSSQFDSNAPETSKSVVVRQVHRGPRKERTVPEFKLVLAKGLVCEPASHYYFLNARDREFTETEGLFWLTP